jgi:hypothetical protein
MRTRLVAVLLLLGTWLQVAAQVSVEVVLGQANFLPGEQLLAGVRIVNRSGQTLHLGEGADWVQFTIEKNNGGFVAQSGHPPVEGVFDLESTKQATMKVDLQPCFDLSQPGRYLISATVKMKDWNKEVTAKAVPFDVIEGTKLWEQAFGVPPPPGTSEPPEVRKYTLQEANYLKEQLRLYLRVSTAEGRVLKLINVGPMISFGQPEPQLDSRSQLHLLYQNGAKRFAYLIVDPAGEIKLRQTYEYTDSRPRLRLDDKGQIAITGGVRRVMLDDLPAPTETKNDGQQINP